MNQDASEGRQGYGLGIGLHIWQNGSCSVRSGFEYNNLRQWYDTFSADAGFMEKDVTMVIQSLSVPVLFRYRFWGKVQPFAEAGFFLEQVVSAQRSGVIYDYSFAQPADANGLISACELSGINSGPQGSIGVLVPAGKNNLSFSLSYRHGLREWGCGDSTSPLLQNRSYRFSVGYCF